MVNPAHATQYPAWLCRARAQYLFIPSIQLSLSSCEVVIQLAQGRHGLTGVSLRQQLLLYDLELGEQGLAVGCQPCLLHLIAGLLQQVEYLL